MTVVNKLIRLIWHIIMFIALMMIILMENDIKNDIGEIDSIGGYGLVTDKDYAKR